jgi:hypothetical protein
LDRRRRRLVFKMKAVQIDQRPQQSLTFLGESRCDSKEAISRKNLNGKDRQRTCMNIHSRLRRGYFGNAHNAGGNHRRCILVRYSSPGTCAQMTPVAAVIDGRNTGTASALELELPVKTGVSTTHKSSVAVKALSQDDIKSRYQPRPGHARQQSLPLEPC